MATPTRWQRHLPWIDSGAALTAGVAILLAHSWLAGLYGLPEGLLLFMGAVNLAYTVGGVTVGLTRAPQALACLVAANAGWAAVCFALAATAAGQASPVGVAALAAEGLFVLALGALEVRYRRAILTAPGAAPVVS